MTVTQVQYVLEVSRCQNISKAARNLFISQSALSQQIQRLETELGYPLFDRTVQGLLLTSNGVRFCREAQQAIDAWQTFQERIQLIRTTPRRRLRIGLGSRVFSNGLFQDVMQFFDRHPELDVAFVTEAGKDFLACLKDGSIDLALDRLPSEDHLDHQQDFYSCSLIRELQCVLMSPSDPRASLPSFSFRELQGCTMITGLEDSAEDRILKNVCRKYDITPSRVIRSDGIETNMKLVRNGKGLVLGPQSFAAYYQVAAVAMRPRTEISLNFICLNNRIKQGEFLIFRDYLVNICKERGLSGPLPPEQV